jgi:hypothetical protein
MKFLLVQGKRDQAIYGEPGGILGEAAVSFATVKRWCQAFKGGNVSLDDESRPGRPRRELAGVISQFFTHDPFLSRRVLAKRFAPSPRTIKEILVRDWGIKEFREDEHPISSLQPTWHNALRTRKHWCKQ